MQSDVMVFWSASSDGYEVIVLSGCNVLDQYAAGNNPNDSYQDAGEGPAVPARTLRKWARQTALEMARDYGVPKYRVFED